MHALEAYQDGLDHGRTDRTCVLDGGLEPDREMALEAMLECEPLPVDPLLFAYFQRGYLRGFLRDEERCNMRNPQTELGFESEPEDSTLRERKRSGDLWQSSALWSVGAIVEPHGAASDRDSLMIATPGHLWTERLDAWRRFRDALEIHPLLTRLRARQRVHHARCGRMPWGLYQRARRALTRQGPPCPMPWGHIMFDPRNGYVFVREG